MYFGLSKISCLLFLSNLVFVLARKGEDRGGISAKYRVASSLLPPQTCSGMGGGGNFGISRYGENSTTRHTRIACFVPWDGGCLTAAGFGHIRAAEFRLKEEDFGVLCYPHTWAPKKS